MLAAFTSLSVLTVVTTLTTVESVHIKPDLTISDAIMTPLALHQFENNDSIQPPAPVSLGAASVTTR
ncbi:hypothetical protein GCM10010982_07240 [Bowmanella pacifica]|uniref:Uncharacterized protein n=1 Tax=Bowmanella pacifica TaxID=502051 RepID=A0A917YVD5_9ALTE|nr:hypothetical protein GCM10010982_07240 [Bowmanella pacifica]